MFANHPLSFANSIDLNQSQVMVPQASPHKASDKRRAQNRAAQKTYREKKKRRLQELEDLAANAGLIEKQSPDQKERQGSDSSSSQDSDLAEASATAADIAPTFYDDAFAANLTLQGMQQATTSAHANVVPAPVYCDAEDNIVPAAGPIDWSTTGANDPNMLSLTSSIVSAIQNTTSSSPYSLSQTQSTPQSLSPATGALIDESQFFNPTINIGSQVWFQATSLQAAYLQILHHIGHTLPDPCTGDGISSFYSPDALGSRNENAIVRLAQANFSHIKPDLRPTRKQILVKHVAWLDVLPFPDVRDRLIELLTHDPPLLNEEEFCSDIENGGVVCWGSVGPDCQAEPICVAPWDSRSWEAKTWFLNKWNWLIGDESLLARNSDWWRCMRGFQTGLRF